MLYTNTSLPSILYGFDQGIVHEIPDTVRNTLSRDFNISAGTRGNSASARADDSVQENIKRALVVATNLGMANILREGGYKVTDLCVPG